MKDHLENLDAPDVGIGIETGTVAISIARRAPPWKIYAYCNLPPIPGQVFTQLKLRFAPAGGVGFLPCQANAARLGGGRRGQNEGALDKRGKPAVKLIDTDCP